MIVWVVVSRDPHEGSSDVDSVWATQALADAECKRLREGLAKQYGYTILRYAFKVRVA